MMKCIFSITLIILAPQPINLIGLEFKKVGLDACLIDDDALCDVASVCFSDAYFVSVNTILDNQANSSKRKFQTHWVLDSVLACFKAKKPVVLVQTKSKTTNDFNKLDTGGLENPIGYLIIAWNMQTLLSVLENGFRRVFPNSRVKYLVIFVGKREPEILLFEIWSKYQIFRVTSYEICTPDVVHLFRLQRRSNSPFERSRKLNFKTLKTEDISPFYIGDYEKYPLKVVMFPRKPTVIETEYGYIGLDGKIVENLGKYYNFEIIYSEGNKSFMGSVGEIINKRVDLAANGLFLIDYGSDQYEYTIPYWNDYLCFVVPKASIVPKWKKLFYSFTLSSWIAIVCLYFFLLLIWYIIVSILTMINQHPTNSSWLQLFAFFTTQAAQLPYSSLIERIFIASSLIFCIIITGTFQGGLFTSFSTLTYMPDIDTLEDLYNSDLRISTTIDIFRSNSGIISRLAEKLTYSNGNTLQRAILNKDVAALDRQTEALFYTKTEYISPDNEEPLLHMVDECLVSHFVAYMVPKGSPFLSDFNYGIRAFMEAGLMSKWAADAFNQLTLRAMFGERAGFGGRVKEAFSVCDLQLAFVVLAVGLILAFGVFFVEVLVGRFRKKWVYLYSSIQVVG